MKRPVESLHFRDEDRQLLPIAALSQQARISQAFIRLCVSAGCLAPQGMLSQAQLIEWLVENFVSVRALAGLLALPSLSTLTVRQQSKRKMAFAILTLLEFGESRCSDLDEKAQLRWIRSAIEGSLDHE